MFRILKNFILIVVIFNTKIICAENLSFFVDVNPYRGTVSTIENVVSSSIINSNDYSDIQQKIIQSKNDTNYERNSIYRNQNESCVNINSFNSVSKKISYQEQFWIKQSSKGIYDKCGKKSNNKILERATLLNKIVKNDSALSEKFSKKYPKISFINISNKNKNNDKYYESLLGEIDNLREDLILETNGNVINRYLYESLNLKLKTKAQALNEEEKNFYINYVNNIYTPENIQNISSLPKYKDIKSLNNNKIATKLRYLEELNPLFFYYLKKNKIKINKKSNIKINNIKTQLIHDLSILFNS